MNTSEQAILDAATTALHAEMLTTLLTYENLLRLVLEEIGKTDGVDKNLVAIARHQLELGFMVAARAVRTAKAEG